MAGPEKIGQWGKTFNFLNVPVHASLLPTGKVLYWGRRWNFDPQDLQPTSLTISRLDMNQHATKAFLWTPAQAESGSDPIGQNQPTATQPKTITGQDVSLFCSGHSFQSDGCLLVVGGHIEDGKGVNQACVYNPFSDTWTAKPAMNNGRWYPSAIMQSDGSVLSISGSFFDAGRNAVTTNTVPQIWRNNAWVNILPPPTLISYPRLHLDPKGRVFMAGPQATSKFLNRDGTWAADELPRVTGEREFAPSVSYDGGKIIYIGGGNDPSDGIPTNRTEIIDLGASTPAWKEVNAMLFRRRQHNATVLPDGTVLVTGGTQGTGFSNVSQGMPVHTPELWDPVTNTWTKMANESDNRCYHSIALLLPDGQVLSAGGGEGADNPTIVSAQVFKPSYFFKGARPTLTSAPSEIGFDQASFEVTISDGNFACARASWIRLGSTTHTVNMNQSLNFLQCKQQGSKVIVTAPANKNLAPPGHYMLFLLNKDDLPSKPSFNNKGVPNNIIWLKPQTQPSGGLRALQLTPEPTRNTIMAENIDHSDHSLPLLNERIINEQDRPHVVVGLTPVCPYGLGACWGGAFDALQRMTDIDVVRPVPHQPDSVAFVYLKGDILPDLDVWRSEFEKTANGSYHMRGIEMSVSGRLVKKMSGAGEQLTLLGTATRPDLTLLPFQESSKIEYDMWAKVARQMSDAEAGAYDELTAALAAHAAGLRVQVTGRLHKLGTDVFSLEVRAFKLEGVGSSPKL